MTMSKRVNGINLLSVSLLEHFIKLGTNLADKMSLGRLCHTHFFLYCDACPKPGDLLEICVLGKMIFILSAFF